MAPAVRSLTLSSLIHAGLFGLALFCGFRLAGGGTGKRATVVVAAAPAPTVFTEPEELPIADPEPEPARDLAPEAPLPEPEWTEHPLPPRPETPAPRPERPDFGPGFFLDPVLAGIRERTPETEATAPPEPVAEAVPVAPEAIEDAEAGTEESVLLEAPTPRYPRASIRRGEEGRVLCRMHIDASGRVVRVEVLESSGHRRLDEAACAGLLHWRFKPRTEGGSAVGDVLDHPVEFRLE